MHGSIIRSYVGMWHVGYVLYRALVVYEKLLVLSRVGAYSMIDCKLWQLRAANCKALSQTDFSLGILQICLGCRENWYCFKLLDV